MVRSIAFVGDLLRPTGMGDPGGTDRATQWLFNALKRPVQLACGLPVELVTASNGGLADRLAAARAPADSALYWAARYDALPQHEPLLPEILDRLTGRFCIGAELPPYMIALLTACGIPWIDIRLHPVRFLDDLLFAVRAGYPATQATLLGESLHEAEVMTVAGLVEAMCQYIADATIPGDSLLVIGQRPMDSSQIVNGRFFDAGAHAAGIAAICANYRALLLKPHPLPDEVPGLLAVAAGQPNLAGVMADNVYRLLALPEIAAVLTVNSSVAYEAPYFGKHVHTLAPLPIRLGWHGDAPTPDIHASIRDNVLIGDFWRLVLAPHTSVTPPDGMRLPPKPNRLRIARDGFWNYQQIDTDRIPGGR
jgi:hypothetical protein